MLAQTTTLRFSPSQLTTPLDVWLFQYRYLSEQKRSILKKLTMKPIMAAGSAIGNAMAVEFDKSEGLTHRLNRFEKHDSHDWGAGRSRVENFEPAKWSDDFYKKQIHHKKIVMERIDQTYLHTLAGLSEILDGHETIAEKEILTRFEGCSFNILGFADFVFFDSEGTATIVELKTLWDKPQTPKQAAKGKKTTQDFKTSSLPLQPRNSHVQQVAVYCHGLNTENCFIVYGNKTGHRIFSNKNCPELSKTGLYNAKAEMRIAAIVRENITGLRKVETMTRFIVPDFTNSQTNFYWEMPPDYLAEAKALWGMYQN